MAEEQRSFLQKAVESTVTTLIAALIIGFFGMVWKQTSSSEERIRELQALVQANKIVSESIKDVYRSEISGISANLKTLEEKIKHLESRTNSIPEFSSTLPIPGPPILGVPPTPHKSDPIESLRGKELDIDQKIQRQIQQQQQFQQQQQIPNRKN